MCLVTSHLPDLHLGTVGFSSAPNMHSTSTPATATELVSVTSKARGGSTALDRIPSLRSGRACSSRRSTTPPPFSPPPLPRLRVVGRRSLAPLRSLAPPPPTRLHDPRPRCVRSDTVAAQHRPQLSPPPRDHPPHHHTVDRRLRQHPRCPPSPRSLTIAPPSKPSRSLRAPAGCSPALKNPPTTACRVGKFTTVEDLYDTVNMIPQ